MKIKKLQDNEYINNITVISHVTDVLDFGTNKYEIKNLVTKIITDGKIDDENDFEIDVINEYELDDGYVIKNIDYIKKSKISFKNFSYIVSYSIVLKKIKEKNNEKYCVDICDVSVYLKSKDDKKTLSEVRKILKKIKKQCKKINNPFWGFSTANKIKPKINDNIETLSENIYRLKLIK